MAAEWGLPPWQVEEAPAVWVDRWVTLRVARNNQAQIESRRRSKGLQGNRKRLM